MSRAYLILTADIVDSRHHIGTPEKRHDLLETLDSFYHQYKEEFLTQLRISRGDEIQGVIAKPREFAVLLRRLRTTLLPLEIRASFGMGEISSKIVPEDPWAMDGAAFHRAREGMNALKPSRWQKTTLVSDNPIWDRQMEAILMLIDTIQERWTPGQWEAVEAYERWGTYEAAAKALNVSFQSVEKRCRAARWPVIREAETRIGEWMELAFN